MNRKIILLPLASFLVLGLGSCGKTASSSQASTGSASSSSSSSSSSDSTTPVATTNKITDIVAEGTYTIKAVVVAVSANSVLLDDTYGRVSYFNKGKCGSYVIGDYYKVSGAVTKADNYRYGNFQFTSTATFTQLDKSKAPAVDQKVAAYDAAAFKTWADSMKADAKSGWTEGTSEVKGLEVAKRPLVTIETQIKISGTYTNGYVDGVTDYDVSYTGTDASLAAFSAGDGKFFTVTGYLYEVVAQKHAAIFVTNYVQKVIAPTTVTVTAAESATFVRVGEKLQLSAVVGPTGADQGVTWKSSNETAATIDENGVVSGLAVATGVEFTATSTKDTSISGKLAIDVHEANTTPITSLTIAEGSTYSLPIGVAHTFSASILPVEANQNVVWASETVATATIDAGTGVVTPIATGTTNITATSVGKDSSDKVVVATLALTVTEAPGEKTMTSGEVLDWASHQATSGEVKYNENYVSVSGILENIAGTKYGAFYITEVATGKSLKVYGSSPTNSGLAFAAGVISYTNPEDAITTEAGYHAGDSVTVRGLVSVYNGTAEIQGIVTAEAATTGATYTASINTPENGTATLDVTKDLAYGATVTITTAPKTGYEVESIVVTTAFGTITPTTVAENTTYTFAATCVNSVAVAFHLIPVQSGSAIALDSASVLGYDGSANVGYATSVVTTKKIDALTFDYLEVGAYKSGFAGMQMKTKQSATNEPSYIASHIDSGYYITSIVVKTYTGKAQALTTLAGATSVAGLSTATAATAVTDTTALTETYTFTEAAKIVAFKFAHIASGSTAFIESLTINFGAKVA